MNISKDKIILKKIESPKKDWTGKEMVKKSRKVSINE